ASIRAVPHSLARVTVGVLVALALNPLVNLVQRRLRNRAVSVGVVFGVLLVSLVAFIVFAAPPAIQQSRQLPRETPPLMTELTHAPLIGPIVRQHNLDERVHTFLDDLPHILTTRDRTLTGAARSAGEALLALSWTLLVSIAALLDGPTLTERA